VSRGLRTLLLAGSFALLPSIAHPSAPPAHTFSLSSAELADSAIARSMPRLAADVLAATRDDSSDRLVDHRFRLELLTGRYAEAASHLEQSRARRVAHNPRLAARALYVQYEIHARAKEAAARTHRPYAETFADAFRATFSRLDDTTSALVARAMLVTPSTVANDLRWATPDLAGRTSIGLDEALTLLDVYSAVVAYREFAGLPQALVTEDDRRRYRIEPEVAVRTPDGATVCAIVVRPRSGAAKRPTLLQFTIYADSVVSMREALRAASHGYVGVTGFTRGKACSPDTTVPYVYDGRDAAALIDWIAAQPWSDGRVGMYGGSYSGFTAWAAAKYMPKALRAIMVGAPAAPGIDVPMEGNVFWSFVYPWPFYTTNNRWLDNPTYNDSRRWNGLYREWYRSGRAYRDLEKIDGTPNPGFAAWLAHPALDDYWKSMVPQGAQYAKITIPVLQTAGYFFGGPGGATHYYLEHLQNSPHADHTLVIGPFDHLQAQRGVVTALGDTASYLAGYEIDPVARIDMVEDLRYPWFDFVFRGGPKPAMLKDRVNYQVMGTNTWRSAPTLAAAAPRHERLYLVPAPAAGRHLLRRTAPPRDAAIEHTVDFTDRSDIDGFQGGGLVASTIDTSNAVVFVSEPLASAEELTGLLSGRLELTANRKDFDFSITPYEWTADGTYFQFPPFQSRASHVGNLTVRRLLTPGKRETLAFAGRLRMMSRRVAAGSRIVLVLAVIRNPGQQINYGTGGDVSAESLADAKEPLRIRWLGGSYVDLPIGRE
jgi:putative CocE/NonD family hydrolase